MPILDDKLLSDFRKHTEQLQGTKTWLNDLYYHPEFSSLFNRPVISMLITACDYLRENLITLRQKYELGARR